MNYDKGSLKYLGASAIGVVTLTAVVLTGLAVIDGFKDSGQIDNSTADLFITGLTVFASFCGVIVLALVGKVIIGLFQAN